jgi:hypothetical protein
VADYHTFTSPRATEPDRVSLVAQLRALDATAGVQHLPGPTYILKKATTWTAPQITAAQNVIDTAPASSPQLTAQALIDQMPIFEKAIVLTLIDELNLLREWIVAFKAQTAAATSLANLQTRVAALPDMPDRTVPQAIAAVRTKAGTL